MIVDRCNLCGCRSSRMIWTEAVGDVAKCSECDFIYSRTVPRNRFERSDSAAHIFEETSLLRQRAYEQILALIVHKSGGQLLDVGCRTGNFLLLAKNKGFDVEAVEPSRRFAQFTEGKGLTVHNCTLKECAFPAGKFDVVTYLEVLEHIHTPREELVEVYRVLKNDGILVLEIPNINFHLARVKIIRLFHLSRLFHRLEQSLMPDDHLVHFSERTIRTMLEKIGFQVTVVLVRVPYIAPKLSMPFRCFLLVWNKLACLARRVFGINISNVMVVVARKNETDH